MDFYADEDFAYPVVLELRRLNHHVITVQEDHRQGIDDASLLARAHGLGRVVLTHNRRHFERLHRNGQIHSGIVSCTRDQDFPALANRIDDAVRHLSIGRWCIRVNRK